MACGKRPSDAHHITTRKAGGHDVPTNLIPLCRDHHAEAHNVGMKEMASRYPIVHNWVQAAERWDILPASAAKNSSDSSKKPKS